MNDRNIYIQKCILDAVYEELDKRNIPREECLKFLLSNTIIKESRLKAILSGTNKRPITLRELAKITGISRSTLNDIVNGKIKKIKLDDLYQISIPLELNLEDLLDACGFNNVIKTLSRDRYEGMSTRQLKELLDEYQKSEYDLLDWDAKKRKTISSARDKLFSITNKIEMSKRSDMKYTKDDIAKDVKEAFDELESVQDKYDYSKLPKKH